MSGSSPCLLARTLCTPDLPLKPATRLCRWPTHVFDYASRWNVTTEAKYPNTFADGACKFSLLANTVAGEVVSQARVNNAGFAQVRAVTRCVHALQCASSQHVLLPPASQRRRHALPALYPPTTFRASM